MVDIFSLWHFFQFLDQSCEFDVTMREEPRIKEGTSEWMRECLSTFGVSASARSWKVIPFRSLYYSSYPDYPNWEDRWQEGWIVQVLLNEKIQRANDPRNFPIRRVDIFDTTWDGEFEDPRHNSTALLISSYRSNITQVERLANELDIRIKAEGITQSQSQIRTFEDGYYELRITLNGVTFPDIVPTLESLLDLCKERGGIVNYLSSLL